MKTSKNRPIVATSGVGEKRYHTYRALINQYHNAMANGFYIEAIALMESIISDRLESFANELSSSSDYSYSTMEKLLTYLCGKNQKDKVPVALLSIFDELSCWKDNRNKACHEMAKNINSPFYEQYEPLEDVADEGYDLFRKLDNAIDVYRKNK